MERDRVVQWLLDRGFTRIRHHHKGANRWRNAPYGIFTKGEIVVIVKKLAVRVELKLPEPRYVQVGKKYFQKTHERVTGSYFNNITIDEFGRIRGLGFESNAKMHAIVYDIYETVGE